MSNGKITNILKKGLDIGSVLTGGKVKSIIEIVNGGILNPKDELNIQPLKDLAEVNESQNEVLINHEQRLRAIEAELKKK